MRPGARCPVGGMAGLPQRLMSNGTPHGDPKFFTQPIDTVASPDTMAMLNYPPQSENRHDQPGLHRHPLPWPLP